MSVATIILCLKALKSLYLLILVYVKQIELPLLLWQVSVDCNRWEVLLSQDLIKLDCVLNLSHEDDNLVEHERIQQVCQSSDLLIVLQFHVVLLQTMESKLAFVVDEDLELVLHELSANVLDFT